MADYGPGYDPIQADYISAGDQSIGALIELTAFAAIGIGAFFTIPAMEAGTALEEGITVNGTTYYGVSQEIAEALDALGDGPISQDAATGLVGKAIQAAGALGEADGIVVLSEYDTSLDEQDYEDFSDYLDATPDPEQGCFNTDDWPDMCPW